MARLLPQPTADAAARVDRLRARYTEQLDERPDDLYLQRHLAAEFVGGTERVFRFYLPWIEGATDILDWGCRHAPDAVLLRDHFGGSINLDGCDLIEPEAYAAMYRAAGMTYCQLDHPYRLPYDDASFDAVIASGVLEHVPMDYESLKELWRVMRPGARLIVTYLPNRGSLDEWRLRRRGEGGHHRRTYTRAQLRALLQHAGFEPLVIGYQTQLDQLASDRPSRSWAKAVGGRVLAPATSCLCAAAEKMTYF